MSITAARLQAEVGADTKGFDKGMAHADQVIAKAPSKWGTALKIGAGAALSVGAIAVVKGMTDAVGAGIASLREQGVVVAQTNAAIKSTGGAARVTAAQVRDLANATEAKTAIDDKQVQAGANMLLTFTNIRNAAGAGNDIFNQSVAILADMSTAMGTDMKSGAIQLGKALNDPVKGMTALSRVGVTFDDQQAKRIKQYMAEGQVAKAQTVILQELNKEFGGSGAAFAATDAGQAAKFQDSIEGIQQALAQGVLPAVTNVRMALTEFLNDPATLGQAQALGEAIGSIFSVGNLKTAASAMTTAAHAVGGAIELFGKLPPQIQALAVGAIALNKITGISPVDIGKGVLDIFGKMRGSSPATPMFVADVTGGLGKGAGLLPEIAGGAGAMSLGAVSALAAGGGIAIAGIQELGHTLTSGIVGALTGNQAAAQVAGRMPMTMIPDIVGTLDDIKRFFTGEAPRQSIGDIIAQGINEQNKANPNALSPDARDRANAARQANAELAHISFLEGEHASYAKQTAASVAGMDAKLDTVHADLQTQIGVLETSKDPKAQTAAVAAIVAAVLRQGVGGPTSNANLLARLKAERGTATDPGLIRALDQAIEKLGRHIKGEEWIQAQKEAARKIAASNETTKQKVDDLKAIERSLLARGDTNAASIVRAIRESLTVNISIATSGTGTRATVRHVTRKQKGTNEAGGGGDQRGQALGAVGITNGLTDIGFMGEAGREVYAILRNPRRLLAPASATPSGARPPSERGPVQIQAIVSPRQVPSSIDRSSLFGRLTPKNGAPVFGG